jgi:hypothetical protein
MEYEFCASLLINERHKFLCPAQCALNKQCGGIGFHDGALCKKLHYVLRVNEMPVYSGAPSNHTISNAVTIRTVSNYNFDRVGIQSSDHHI